MTLKQSVYTARSRRRGFHDAAAVQKGWRRIDVLRAYLTRDEELVVIDMDDNAYTTTAEAMDLGSAPEPKAPVATAKSTVHGYALPEGVIPDKVSTIDRVKVLRSLDINGNSFDDIRKHIVRTAKVALAALEMHDAIGPGPEWREELERLAKEA